MYIGRDFKRDIELDNLKICINKLRPNRSWLDLFSLSLSNYFCRNEFDFTTMTDNLNEDEVIIIDSHDDIFKAYQIQYWRKDRISDILPAIECLSFKSETKIFKILEMDVMKKFIENQNHTKSIVIENTDEELSINLVYGDTIKITPRKFSLCLKTSFFDNLQERYKLWEIDDCACKPKKIRVWVNDFKNLIHTIDQLSCIPNTYDAKLGIEIDLKNYGRSFFGYDAVVFNHSARWISGKTSKFMFSGDTLAVVYDGNYYNFRLDQRTKESKDSYIEGNIIESKSKNCFAFGVYEIKKLRFIQTDKENINSDDKDYIEDLKEKSAQPGRCFIVFDKKDITLKIDFHEIDMKIPEQEYYSKVDAKINSKVNSKDITCMLKKIPNHLELRLEADYIKQIIDLMKSKALIEKLKEQGTNFLYNGIEIEPRIIESKMDEDDLKNEVKEIEAKRVRLNMDCDK